MPNHLFRTHPRTYGKDSRGKLLPNTLECRVCGAR